MTDPVIAQSVDDGFLAEIYAELLNTYGIDYCTGDETAPGLLGPVVAATSFYVERKDLAAALDAFEEACCFWLEELDDEDEDRGDWF